MSWISCEWSSRLSSSPACFCRKSWISYPHWPPSTYHMKKPSSNSVPCCSLPDLIDPLWLYVGCRSCWAQRQRNSAYDDSDHSSIVRLLRDNCPILSSDQDRPRQTRKWQREDCDRFCQTVLRDKSSSYCLCPCYFHPRHIGSPSYWVQTIFYFHFFINFVG